MLAAAALRANAADRTVIGEALRRVRTRRATRRAAVTLLTAEDLLAVMRRNPDRSAATRYRELELVVDRDAARFSAWYELFPRSQGRTPGQATSLKQAEWRLPDIASDGIRRRLPAADSSHRAPTARDEQLARCRAARRGQPVRHRLGRRAATRRVRAGAGRLEEFDHFRRAVQEQGMELAIDFAIQASPDHPWVASIPSGSVTRRTARSSTPRIRPRNTRTSTRSTSTTTQDARGALGRAAAGPRCSGSSAG